MRVSLNLPPSLVSDLDAITAILKCSRSSLVADLMCGSTAEFRDLLEEATSGKPDAVNRSISLLRHQLSRMNTQIEEIAQ